MGKTRGVHETTPEVRNRMVGMYEAGLGLREIAAAVNCSQRTVKRWLNRFDKEGSVETRDRCGRKRATTQEQDEAIIRLATQTPITAAKAVLPALGLNCSVDTVRERLHKAGIHNWSPSRKHIQKIPIAATDGAGIQQAVWRPTGTQLGKKKLGKEINKNKTKSQVKKKMIPQKSKSKESTNNDKISSNALQSSDVSQNFSFTSLQNEQMQPQATSLTQPQTQLQSQSQPQVQQQIQSQMQEMQPIPLPLHPSHPTISSNLSQYSHAINLIPQAQTMYHHHPGHNASQNWPLDLVQGTHSISHQYSQTQQTTILQEQHLNVHIQNHSQLHNQHNTQLAQNLQGQIESPIQSHVIDLQQKVDQHPLEHQELSNLSHGKLNESQDVIINVCSDICSNSDSSSNENSQNSSVDDGMNNHKNCSVSKITRKERLKKKKGGKIKGTLETSVEIRNRMIGMSEAGLSTLSIALAINRSERTVKRWLDRWHKEGNVQTKERKGRRRITTKEQDEAIIAMATQNPLTAAKYVAPALGLKCSVDTIRERLHKAGIHSWKLGKKQGQGNAVHTVHLWQPSGNRSIKVKTTSEKKKRPESKKHFRNSEGNVKKNSKKQTDVPSIAKSTARCRDAVAEVVDVPFQNQSQSSAAMLPATHDLTNNSGLVQSHLQHPPACSQDEVSSQSLQTIDSEMQQRPDCRLALSSIVPHIPTQSGANIAYPSCMIGNSTHAVHMEQSDPMNYEPYIWSF